MRRYKSNRRRLEWSPVVILFVFLLLLDPDAPPAFALDAGADRMISAKTVVFAAKAEAEDEDEEVSGKHLGIT